MNQWLLSLYLEEIKHPNENLIYIKWVNKTLGYGIFANQNLPSMTYIGEYTGVINRKLDKDALENDYLFSYDICGQATKWAIDAKNVGNITRFINHSWSPNLTSRWVIYNEIPHIIFFTNQRVKRHDQLFYSYGALYWKSRPPPL